MKLNNRFSLVTESAEFITGYTNIRVFVHFPCFIFLISLYFSLINQNHQKLKFEVNFKYD